jgi:membrane protease YdiL (CAAX protease family)
MKNIARLFLVLICGWISIVLILSAVFAVSPFEFFAAAKNFVFINVVYLLLLYGCILSAIHFLIKKEGGRGIADLGLSFEKGTIYKMIGNLVIAFLFFGCYILLLINCGAIYLNTMEMTVILIEILKGLLFGFLFAFVEEIFFRGYIFTRLEAEISSIPSMVIVSILFAGLHLLRPGDLFFKILYFIGLFLVGVVLSAVYIRTRSLWMSISVHMGWIACMYIVASPIFHHYPLKLDLAVMLGMDSCPVAGISGFVVILLTGMLVLLTQTGSFYIMDRKKTDTDMVKTS